jgi:hypothetical protein
MATSRICTIPDCGKPHVARGYCGKHYQRWNKHGDPLVIDLHPAAKYLRDVVLPYQGDDCLIWPFKRLRNGYAWARRNGKSHNVLRLVCEDTLGQPPTPRHQAAHTCGKGYMGCVNPKHGYWATPEENYADRARHGRTVRGEAISHAKLTEDQVYEIRSLAGTTHQYIIARRFGVSQSSISHILTGKSWKYLPIVKA